METILSTSQETEIMINSCKNNCLLISHFLPFHSWLSKSLFQFSSHIETLVLVAVYFLRQFSSMNYSVHLFPCTHFQLDVPQKLLKIREPELMCVNVCQSVCVYVSHTPNQASTRALLYPSRKFHWKNVPCCLCWIQVRCLLLQYLYLCACVCVH